VNTVAKENENPLSKLELEDIFMVSSECKIAHEYNQTDRSILNLVTVQRMSLEEQLFVQTRIPLGEKDARIQILRFFAIGEVRVAKPGVTAPVSRVGAIASTPIPIGDVEWMRDEDKLASLRHVFAADYRCTDGKVPAPEHLGVFVNNVIFHAWPYWREAVHAECSRMRLPPITVPMLRQGKNQFSSPQVLTSTGEMPVTSIGEPEGKQQSL
jgi:hypothetical protein